MTLNLPALRRDLAALRNALRPGISINPPLYCAPCRRTQRYVSRTTAQLLDRGCTARCWQCTRRMTRLTDTPAGKTSK